MTENLEDLTTISERSSVLLRIEGLLRDIEKEVKTDMSIEGIQGKEKEIGNIIIIKGETTAEVAVEVGIERRRVIRREVTQEIEGIKVRAEAEVEMAMRKES